MRGVPAHGAEGVVAGAKLDIEIEERTAEIIVETEDDSKVATSELIADLRWMRGRRKHLAATIENQLRNLSDVDRAIARLELRLDSRGVNPAIIKGGQAR